MKPSDKFLLRKIGEQNFLVPLGTKVLDFNALVSLNSVGVFIWEMICSENEIKSNEIISSVIENFNVEEVTARQDVENFLFDLKKMGIL